MERRGRAFARARRAQTKWVASHRQTAVGPNASLIAPDLETFARALKAERAGEIDVVGPELAGTLTQLGLIDEYRICLHPVVLGGGKRFFAGSRPHLRLAPCDRMDEDVVRLVYAPARTTAVVASA